MNFADFQEAMLICFSNIGQWLLVLLVAGGIFTSLFIGWLAWLRSLQQLG
jgi:hypothetical protein